MKTIWTSLIIAVLACTISFENRHSVTAQEYFYTPVKPAPSAECNECEKSRPCAECEKCGKGKDAAEEADPCNPWANKPVPRIFPRPGNFSIPPTGCGYYSALDAVRGEAREKPRPSPFVPFALTAYSMFDLDYRFLEKKDFNDPFLTDGLRRIRLGDDFLFSTGGQAHWRYMSENNSRLSGRDNNFNLFRARAYGDLWYQDEVRLFVEFITASRFGGNLPPLAIDENSADLLNAFVDVKLADYEKHPIYARVGRQELLLGSQRFISPLDWANTRRTFEGVRVFRQGEKFDVDAFWTRPVVVDRDEFDDRDHDSDFAGLYTTYRPQKGHFTDLYYLYLGDDSPAPIPGDGGPSPFDIHTFGLRYAGDVDGKFLWDFEGDIQFGSRGGRDVCAGAVSIGGGYHFKDLPWNPTLWAVYDYASGDDNPTDDDFNTFNQLFPFGHYYLGWIDLVGRQNIHDVNAHLYLYPAKWITLWLQYHHFELASRTDALYNAAGIAVRRDPTGTAGTNVGNEIDIVANFHLMRNTDVLIGYSHLYAGSFLRRTAASPAAARDANLFYAMMSLRW